LWIIFQDQESETSGRFQAQVRKAASGRDQPNDTVLLVTGCFQYRPTGAPDSAPTFRLLKSIRSNELTGAALVYRAASSDWKERG
jgi:hypothetical protein